MKLDHVLLGDVEDWIKIIVILIFVLGPLLGQLGKKEPAKPAKPARRPQGRPPKTLAPEVREVLAEANRAAGRNRRKKQASLPADAEPAPPAGRSSIRPSSIQRSTGRTTSSVSEHVKEHMLSHSVSERAEDLGRKLGQTDERVETHLHDVFDHRLGELDRLADESFTKYDIAEGTDLAVWQQSERERSDRQLAENRQALFDLLSRPDQLRNVFVLGEILRPPSILDDL